MSDEPMMGWYDSSMDRESSDFKVDFKEDIKRDYRGDIREYFESLFSWLLRGLDNSNGPRMGWYDSSIVRGG